jgi:hypothetical protein
MNNLILTCVLLGSSGALFFGECSMRRTIDLENRRLSSAFREAVAQRENAASLLIGGRARLETQRAALQELQAQLNADSTKADTPPIDPEHEGLWPTNKSYFYLHKRLLPTAVFQQFKGSSLGLRLHPDTVVALGMTPSEAATVDDGFADLVDRFKKLEVERLTPSTVHASSRWSGRKNSYRMPALRAEMDPPMENFFALARAQLGDSRVEIFEHWARLCIAESLWDFAPTARIFTLTDEEMRGDRRLTRFEMVEEGGKQLYYFELWNPPRDYGMPDEARPRFPYWHLFGDNGEKRPEPQLSTR